MLITIYDRYDKKRADISPDDSSTQQKEIQGDNVLSLSFTLYAPVSLDVDDWCEWQGERYWLTERYRPQQKSEREWTYDVKLYGVESMIKRILVVRTLDGDSEPVFTLTAPARDHVAMIVGCMNDGLGGITDWKVGQVDGGENIVIDYEGKCCDEALREVAEKAGAEWWVEGQTVNVCRCEHGEPLTLGYGEGLTDLSADKADNVSFYTRLWPVGSSRNIDPDKYGHTRLQLPGGRRWVEVNADKYGRVDRYEAEVFADIYPRRTGVVSSVRSEVKTGEDGKPFTIYYFKDNALPFDPSAYMIGGKVMRVSFQEGSELAGLGEEEDGTYFFEVNYDARTQEFEIITIWPYDDDTQLPGGNLVPAANNRYILWNMRMPDEYYPLAEEELLTAVEKYNRDNALDVTVFKGATDHVWVEESGEAFHIGRRVRLESGTYFPETGFRDSRITKITRKVNLPGQMDLEIGDALSRTAMERMGQDITDVRNYTQSATSGALPDVIRTWDRTLPTDNNLFSARRSQREFLSKTTRDRAREAIIFEKGLETGDYIPGSGGAAIDAAGNAEVQSVVVRELLRSARFVDGLTGEGHQLWIDADGLSHLTLDRLTVRQVMTVLELLINKVRSVGGQICVSAANGKIKEAHVDTDGDWRITWEGENTFEVGDLMRCSTFTGGKLKSYWAEVHRADGTGVWADPRDFPEGSEPEAGDEVVLMGSTGNPSRQNLILISATEDGQPRVDVMDGVRSRSLAGCLRARLGNLDGISDTWFPADNQPHGDGLYADNAYLRGTFLLTTGEDVKTRFEVVEGKIESMVEGVRQDFVADKGYLSNAAFADGMDKWATENEAVFFLVGNCWVWANGGVLTKKGDCASVCRDMGRTVVRIRNKGIVQRNANLRSKPEFAVNSEGLKEAVPVYLTFFYRCISGGRLTVGFSDVDKTGFANFNSMEVTEDLEPTEGYRQFSCDGLWNGTGDFTLMFTGEMCLYMLILSTDKVEALTHKYRTLFEQSERLIRICAAVYDKDGNALRETGLLVRQEGSGLYAQDADGNVALIGVSVNETDAEGNTVSVVKLTADHIRLEGLVTANGNFKILEDGSIETINGKFLGEVVATSGKLGGTRQYNYQTGEYEIVGGFEIASGRIGSVATSQGGGGGLAIYDNFMRVGGEDGYVMFGNDVIPSSLGGAFTATGRIVNEHQNTNGSYGFDQANYGLLINVSGGTKNYGVFSDAALMAPAFINTKAKLLTLEGSSYSLDFSQRNIVLLYYNNPNYDATEVMLPTESSVADKFGMNSLPDDFAAVVLFRVRSGSKRIILKGIYNHNEDSTDYPMEAGDSVLVLITKADGFRYQIINYTS